jgi:prophage antirepressor-like protein
MQNEIKIFENKDFGQIRMIEIDEQPWFVGKDVCVVFGDKNHSRSLSRIDGEDKMESEITDSLGRNQRVIVINESGFYALLFQMQPQKAHNGGVSDEYPIEIQQRILRLKLFKRWVTSEVLPSIRKHGAYIMDNVLDQLLENPEAAMKFLATLKEERGKKEALEKRIEEIEPKAQYYDTILQCPGAVHVSIIAKDYGKYRCRHLPNYSDKNKIPIFKCECFKYQQFIEISVLNIGIF